jgi:hypothetical protein
MTEHAYWEHIERYFTEKRGNTLILSPKDWPLVQSWQERGIPLEVIYQGIDRAFARFAEQHLTPQRQTVQTLTYCQYDVEEVWKTWQQTGRAGQQVPSQPAQEAWITERQRLTVKLKSVISQLQKHAQNPHYHHIQAELLTCVQDLQAVLPRVTQAEDADTLAHLKDRLRSLEQRLLDALEQALDQTTRQRLHAQTEAQLAAYKHNMSARVYEETFRIALQQTLHDVYPLPSFF